MTTMQQERSEVVRGLRDQLESSEFQVNELREALAEAQTIIGQQQEQLAELIRDAARTKTNADTLKMKNLFLSLGASSRDEQMQMMAEECERFEAEVETLKWNLDQFRRTQTRLKNERDHLLHQLQNKTEGKEEEFTYKWVTDQTASTETALMTPTLVDSNSIILQIDRVEQDNVELKKRLDRMVYLDQEKDTELSKLREEVERLRQLSKEWNSTQDSFLIKQKQLQSVNGEQESHIRDLMLSIQELKLATEIRQPSPFIEYVQQAVPDESLKQQLDKVTGERNTWKLYANSLVRNMIEHCEELLKATSYVEPEFRSQLERRWYVYAMDLLELLMEVAPNRVSELDGRMLRKRKSLVIQYANDEQQIQRRTPTSRNEAASSNVISTISIPQPQTSEVSYSKPERLTAVHLSEESKKPQRKWSFTKKVAKLARKPVIKDIGPAV